jgi:hypothetical protein
MVHNITENMKSHFGNQINIERQRSIKNRKENLHSKPQQEV